jgi:hypothetical protein
MRECTSKEKYLNAEQQDEILALGRLDTGSHQHKTLSYAITEENCTQNWIIVGPKNQNSKHDFVGYLDYNVGQDKGNPRIYFGWTLANLIELVYTPPRAQILFVADLI